MYSVINKKGNHMILNIKNLGPIKKAKVDISKNILFFVGYNNSGKTYLSQLIWGIFNEYFFEKFVQEVDVDSIINLKIIDSINTNNIEFEILIKKYATFIEKNMHIIYKTEKKYFKDFKIELEISDDVSGLIEKNINITFLNALNKDDIINISTISNNNTLEINATQFKDIENIKRRIIHFILLSIFEGRSFYLPSVRGAYTTFYEYIYKIEKEKKDEIDNFFLSNERDLKKLLKIVQQSKPSYTMAMNELISKMIELKQENLVNEKYSNFCQNIEQLLGGEIKIHKLPLGKKELKLHIGNKTLPMYLSSSNTNQLTTLYLYFKYWIKEEERNFLIIDEPEENLHPKNQYLLMNLLVDFVLEGNKLLLTTHSTLMAKIINNYITFAMLPKKEQEKIEQTCLKAGILKDDIEVCFFDGEQVRSYDVEEYGVLFKDFIEIEQNIEQLSNEINKRLYRINNGY